MKNGAEKSRTLFFSSPGNRVLLLVLLFAVLFRFLTMGNIETGGDAASVWFWSKSLLHGLPYSLGHHSARFGMIIPVFLVQSVLGTHPLVYHVAPLLFFFLQVIFIYKIAERAYGIRLAYLSVILLMFLPKMFSHSIQVKPDGFAAAYMVICAWFLIRYSDEEKNPLKYLVLASVFMFLAYLTKVTCLLFLPGIALCIWIMKGRLKHVILFGAILFGLFLSETLAYWLAAGLKFGRLEIIMGSHLSSGNLHILPSFWHLFMRFAKINTFEKIIFSIYAVAVVFILFRARKHRINTNMKAVFIIPLAFLFIITFAVKSFNPLVQAMSFNSRHLVPAEPFMVIIIAWFLIQVYESLAGKSEAASGQDSEKSVRGYIYATAVLSLVCTVVIVAAMPYVPRHGREKFLGEHPFAAQYEYHKILNRAYENGIPIMQEKVVARRWKAPVDAVESEMKKGYSLKEACKRAGVAEKDYRYALGRVRRGDYKTIKIFTHIFRDADLSRGKDFKFPAMEKADIKGRSVGFIVNEDVKKKKNYRAGLFGNDESPVVVMWEKPIQLRLMKLKDFFRYLPGASGPSEYR